MAVINCAISGLPIKVSYGSFSLPWDIGYYHPIFALPYKKLFGLYSKHSKGQDTPQDSYLLFLAFLNATGQVTWKHPVSLDPTASSTQLLIENNIHQLITVLEQTSVITIPSFKQPSFVINQNNCDLSTVHNWILAWKKNIRDFREGYKQAQIEQDILKVENKLTYLIKSGLPEERYADVVANWAALAGDFPKDKADNWKYIIRSVFNESKMFSILAQDLKELRNHIIDNIEPGSIHFHTLYAMLDRGIQNQANFLGMSISACGYALVDLDTDKSTQAVEVIRATAPADAPKATDYPSSAEFLKARLAFRIAQLHAAKKVAAGAVQADTSTDTDTAKGN